MCEWRASSKTCPGSSVPSSTVACPTPRWRWSVGWRPPTAKNTCCGWPFRCAPTTSPWSSPSSRPHDGAGRSSITTRRGPNRAGAPSPSGARSNRSLARVCLGTRRRVETVRPVVASGVAVRRARDQPCGHVSWAASAPSARTGVFRRARKSAFSARRADLWDRRDGGRSLRARVSSLGDLPAASGERRSRVAQRDRAGSWLVTPTAGCTGNGYQTNAASRSGTWSRAHRSRKASPSKSIQRPEGSHRCHGDPPDRSGLLRGAARRRRRG